MLGRWPSTSSPSSSSRDMTAARWRRRWDSRSAPLDVEQRADLLEREPQPPVHDDVLEPFEILRGVEPVARRRAFAGMQQPDLVVVVQRSHRHAELIGHLPHRPHGVHQHSSGHALKGPASRRVRVKSSMRVCGAPTPRPSLWVGSPYMGEPVLPRVPRDPAWGTGRRRARTDEQEEVPMTDETLLQTRSLTKEFRGFRAVTDVDLVVARGHRPRAGRPERGRQDHLVQPPHRVPQPDRGQHRRSPGRTSPGK